MENMARKRLQDIQTDPAWDFVEMFIDEYIKNNLNLNGSVKRDTEFNTVWDRAFAEGGEYHIKEFFKAIEAEARKYIYD